MNGFYSSGFWVCDECGSEAVYVDLPGVEVQAVKKMSEASSSQAVPAIYKTTTLKCKGCGFSVTY